MNKDMKIGGMTKLLFPALVILLLTLIFLPQSTVAHPPSNMELEYHFTDQRLSVTITHAVANPEGHYVERVEINKNDALYLIVNYTSQPTASTFTYTYDVEASDGDVLEVSAICSIAGSITGQTTVEAPSTDEIILIISPEISAINEDTAQIFTVSVYYNDEFLDDVILDIEVKYGSSSNYQKVSAGRYNFTYNAPDVTKELTETIDITASKEGYNDSSERLRFTIANVGDVGGECPPTLDGVIDADEYDFEAKFADGDFRFYWRIADDTIFMGTKVRTKGWVAIGIDPSDRMKDADMIIGWVTDAGDVNVLDCFSTGVNGPHPPDTDIGGTRDILCYGGEESGGSTIIELKRLLSTGDGRDKNIPSTGELKIIWAFGSNDNFDAQHTKRGYGSLSIASGEYSEVEVPSLWAYHATLMTLGFVLMVTAVIIAKFLKKKNWWFKIHKILGLLGAIFSISGLLMAIYMVASSSGNHLRVPHAYLGVIAIIFIFMTPILGFAQFKVKSKAAKIRTAHRWLGRVSLTLMLINIISGLILVGII